MACGIETLGGPIICEPIDFNKQFAINIPQHWPKDTKKALRLLAKQYTIKEVELTSDEIYESPTIGKVTIKPGEMIVHYCDELGNNFKWFLEDE